MQTRATGNGNQRGQQGRPEIRAGRGEDLIRDLMEERRSEIEAMFARDGDPKASYTRAVGLAVSAYKKVQSESEKVIDEHSVVTAALWSFQRKLDPGTEVYFVPFGGKVTPIVSPQGLINLAHRSGFVLAVDARAVFQKEVKDGHFDHELGSTRWVKHKKGSNARPKGKADAWIELAFAYAVIDLKGGQQIIEVHDRGDIEYYRSLSKAKAGLWFDWPAEAARKAVLKQALNRAPKQAEVSEILTADSANEAALEVGEDFWKAVDERLVGGGSPQGSRGNGNGPAAGPKLEPGDPSKLHLPGKPGTMPTVADSSDGQLTHWEGILRNDLDAGVFDPGGKRAEHREYYLGLLLTIREVMRGRKLAFPGHAFLGDGNAAPAPAQENRGDGELSPEEEQRVFGEASTAPSETYEG